MKKTSVVGLAAAFCALFAGANLARAQQPPKAKPGPEETLQHEWDRIGHKIIVMAEDWPASRYNYKPDHYPVNKDVRTFGQILCHIAGTNYYATDAALGLGTKYVDENPTAYKTKAEIVAFVKRSFADGDLALERGGDAGALEHLGSWVGMIEHCGEHFGNLVTYYRNNGVIPPESRPHK